MPEEVAAEVKTENSFTPGPWKVGGEWPQIFAVYDSRCIYIAHANTGLGSSSDSGWIGGNPLGRDVAQANARLIAAAPDLYDTLRHLLFELEWVNEQLDLMPDDYADALTFAQAALAKARGEKSAQGQAGD